MFPELLWRKNEFENESCFLKPLVYNKFCKWKSEKGMKMERTFVVYAGYGVEVGTFIIDNDLSEDEINDIAYEIAKEWIAETMFIEEVED